MIAKAHKYLNSISVTKFIFLMVLVSITISILVETICYSFGFESVHPLENSFKSKPDFLRSLFIFFWISLLMPPIETLFFQKILINILQKLKIFNWLSICLISALLFWLAHFFWLAHLGFPNVILSSFFSGLVFAYSYLVYKEKNMQPYLVTAAVHCIQNAIVMLAIFLYLHFTPNFYATT